MSTRSHKIIDRQLVQEFMTQENLSDIPSFLTYILKDKAKSFTDFLIVKKMPSRYKKAATLLLHGSQQVVDSIKPRVSIEDSNSDKEQLLLVYATDNPNYAIFLAIIEIQEGDSASVLVKEGETLLSVNKGFIKGFSSCSNGYVYIIK